MIIRNLIALVVGLIAAIAVTYILQIIVGMLFPPPAGLDFNNPEAIKQYVSNLPSIAILLVLIGYMIAYFIGGFIVARISGGNSALPFILGAVGTLFWILNIWMIPHPLWATLAGFICFIPPALLGSRTGQRR